MVCIKMKKLFLLLFIFSSLLLPQDEELNLDGKFALQFQVGHSFTLRDFQGVTFSGKYHFTNSLAVRLGLGINIINSDGEGDEARRDEDFRNYHFSNTMKYRSIEVKAQLIKYFQVFDEVSFFTGAGPFISSAKSEEERDFVDTSRTDYIYNSEQLEYGIDFIGGVEWFVRNNIGLSAEYGFAILMGNRKNKHEYEYSRYNSESDIFSIRSSHVKFGVSIYF